MLMLKRVHGVAQKPAVKVKSHALYEPVLPSPEQVAGAPYLEILHGDFEA